MDESRRIPPTANPAIPPHATSAAPLPSQPDSPPAGQKERRVEEPAMAEETPVRDAEYAHRKRVQIGSHRQHTARDGDRPSRQDLADRARFDGWQRQRGANNEMRDCGCHSGPHGLVLRWGNIEEGPQTLKAIAPAP